MEQQQTFTRKQLERALRALSTIKKNGPRSTSYGVCANITVVDRALNPLFGHQVVKHYAPSWSEYSGEDEYPVRSFSERSARDEYWHHDDSEEYWSKDTEYGRARWRLVDHLIKCIEADLLA